MRRGRLTALGDTEAVLETLRTDPLPGEKAVAECTITQPGPPAPRVPLVPLTPLKIELLDNYAPGGLPGRMLQRAAIEGGRAVSHDIAADPGTGWWETPAVPIGAGATRRVLVEIEAVAPEAGMAWGPAAGTRFRVSPAR